MRSAASALLLAAIAGCSHGKPETAALVDAVGRFHDADNAAKPAAADAVARVVCTAADVCDAKKLCLAATEPTAQGMRLKAEVQQGIEALAAKELSPDDDAAKALPGKLDEASRLLEQGHAAMPACDTRLFELRKTYGADRGASSCAASCQGCGPSHHPGVDGPGGLPVADGCPAAGARPGARG
jgi:hypothetical protein